MGTTRIKVIDLSSDKGAIKTSRKHAEKLAGPAKIEKDEEEKKHPGKQEVPATEGVTQPEDIIETEKAPEEKKAEPKKIKAKQPAQKRHLGKKYKEALAQIDRTKEYPLKEAVDLLYKTSTTKFDSSVEAHLNVSDKSIKVSVNLPHFKDQAVKNKKILVFADKKPVETKDEIIWANENTVDEILKGKLKANKDFDKVIATPKFMPLLAKAAKTLGPAGLMPNPKNNTVVENIESALKSQVSTGVEFKTQPGAPIIHTKIGNLSYKPEEIEENLKVLISTVGPSKIRKATVATTMGPGIKVNPLS